MENKPYNYTADSQHLVARISSNNGNLSVSINNEKGDCVHLYNPLKLGSWREQVENQTVFSSQSCLIRLLSESSKKLN